MDDFEPLNDDGETLNGNREQLHENGKTSTNNGAKMALICCSQGSYWTCFDKSEKIINELNKNGFSSIYNMETIQYDGYSCGMFSALSMLVLPLFNFDVVKAVEAIGKNGENLGALIGKSVTDDGKKIDIYKIKETTIGYG